MLCWMTPLLDCDLQPELGQIHYRHESAYVRVVGTQACGIDDNGQPFGECPIYLFAPFTSMQEITRCVADPVDPDPGEVWYLRSTAIDDADNEDCGGTL